MIWDIREYESIDSTNLEARRLVDAGAGPGLVVWARHQTAGRGRLGRGWHDLPGKSLAASAVLEEGQGFLAGIAVALSARAAVRRAGGKGPAFKWPNDLVYGWRKAGGILSEYCGSGGARHIVVGLGLNVNYLPEELAFDAGMPATSLLIEEPGIWDVRALLLGMLDELGRRWGRREAELLDEYRSGLAYTGERISVKPPYSVVGKSGAGAESLEGIMEGVDSEGRLVLRVGGKVLRVAAGDVEALP